MPLACTCPACAPVQGRLDGTDPAGDAISNGEIAPGEIAPGTAAAAPSVAGAEGALAAAAATSLPPSRSATFACGARVVAAVSGGAQQRRAGSAAAAVGMTAGVEAAGAEAAGAAAEAAVPQHWSRELSALCGVVLLPPPCGAEGHAVGVCLVRGLCSPTASVRKLSRATLCMLLAKPRPADRALVPAAPPADLWEPQPDGGGEWVGGPLQDAMGAGWACGLQFATPHK